MDDIRILENIVMLMAYIYALNLKVKASNSGKNYWCEYVKEILISWIRLNILKDEMHADMVIFNTDEVSDMALPESNIISWRHKAHGRKRELIAEYEKTYTSVIGNNSAQVPNRLNHWLYIFSEANTHAGARSGRGSDYWMHIGFGAINILHIL